MRPLRCCSFGSRDAESEGRVFPAIRVVRNVRLGREHRRPDWRIWRHCQAELNARWR